MRVEKPSKHIRKVNDMLLKRLPSALDHQIRDSRYESRLGLCNTLKPPSSYGPFCSICDYHRWVQEEIQLAAIVALHDTATC